MLKNLPLLVVLITIASCSSKVQRANEEKPNVLYINVDDLGWKDVGFMGSEWFETPHLDQFASEGMIFTHAYAGAANCAPSRACLMSGQYGPRHGIYTVGTSERGNEKTRKIIPVENVKYLPDELLTMGDMFQKADYVTGTFGKWHLGTDPLKQGFDVNVAGGKNGNPGKNGYFSPYNVPNIEDGPEGEYLTDRLTSEVINFMTTNKDKPFFAYVPFYNVHTPLEPKQELYKKYKNKPGMLSDKQAKYAAMVEAMDINIGRLLQALEDLALEDNTIVIFSSDNGGLSMTSPQDPLRGGKGSYFEGGIRVPLVIKWPGVIEAGAKSEVPVINLDFFPTFRDLLNSTIDKNLEGQSLLPLISGDGKWNSDRALYWHFPIYLQGYMEDARDPLFRTRPGSVIRKGKWKLHEYFEDGAMLLYNLEDDPGEQHNVAAEHPEVVEELYTLLKAWRKNLHAPISFESNPVYDPEFEHQKAERVLSGGE